MTDQPETFDSNDAMSPAERQNLIETYKYVVNEAVLMREKFGELLETSRRVIPDYDPEVIGFLQQMKSQASSWTEAVYSWSRNINHAMSSSELARLQQEIGMLSMFAHTVSSQGLKMFNWGMLVAKRAGRSQLSVATVLSQS